MRANDIFFCVLYLVVLGLAGEQIADLVDANSAVISSELYPTLIIGTGAAIGLFELARTIIAPPIKDGQGFFQYWAPAVAPGRLLLLFLFIAYLALIQLIGFLVATTVFCIGCMILLTPRRNRSLMAYVTALIVSAVLVGFIYLILVVYLQAFLP